MKVGFAGLGHLGRAIVSRLKSQDVDLVVWNRDRTKADGLDLPVAASPADLAGQCEVILLCLFDSTAVDGVLNDPEGLLSADVNRKTIIDTTTNHFKQVTRFHQQLTAAGGHYLEAPVIGSVIPATNGKLLALVSGEQSVYEQQQSLLEKFSRQIFYLPEPGHATRMKLVNNMLLGAFMAAISEALIIAEHSGTSKAQALDILATGAGKSLVMDAKKDRLLNNDFSPHFTAALIHKDLRYLEELAESVAVKSPLATLTRALYDSMMSGEEKGDDFCAIYPAIAKLNQ